MKELQIKLDKAKKQSEKAVNIFTTVKEKLSTQNEVLGETVKDIEFQILQLQESKREAEATIKANNAVLFNVDNLVKGLSDEA